MTSSFSNLALKKYCTQKNAETGTVITMTFDSQGRRTEYKSVTNGVQNTWLRFLYDGYLCIQVLYSNAPYNVFKEFVWDPTEPVATRPLVFRYAPNNLNLFYAFDGNKNVSDVFYRLNSNGIGAHYDYAPFGAVTESGDVSQPFQWSSEVYDSELDLVYYNYRHYSPSLGRFLSRDPIEEQGGLNLYACMGNQPVSITDCLGYAKLEDVLEMLTLIELARERCFKCKKVVSILGNLEDEIYEENEESIGEIMPLVRDFTSAISVYTNGKKKVVDFTVFLEDVFGKESINKDALKDLSGGLGRVTNILNKISAISDFGDSLRRKDGLDLFLTVTNQFPVTQILTGHLRDAYRSALEWSRNMKYIPNNKMLIREARKACRERNGCCTAETILVGLKK